MFGKVLKICYNWLVVTSVSTVFAVETDSLFSCHKESEQTVWAQGRQYPERKDDISFENDLVGYRIYGPQSERDGDRLYGYDVWVKNTPEMVVEKFYADDHSIYTTRDSLLAIGATFDFDSLVAARSYHRDHGLGHDPYAVGPTLGAGAPALVVDGKMVMPYCYTDYEILENGPERFAVYLAFEPRQIGEDKQVVEHRLISLERGSRFCRSEVWYEGLSKPYQLAMGIVVHEADTTSMVLRENYVLYADPTDNPQQNQSQVFLGLYFPDGNVETAYLRDSSIAKGVAGHIVGLTTIQPDEHKTYFFGSAWSKADIKTLSEWENYVLGSKLLVAE